MLTWPEIFVPDEMREQADNQTPDGQNLSPSLRLGHITIALRFDYVWWAVCLLCAGILAWANRHAMNPDGMSYVDMASESLRSGPTNLVNGYWSPLYPALLSLTFAILRPSSSAEFPVVHLANFLIYCAVLLSFKFLIRSWIAVHQGGTANGHCERPVLTGFCYSIFLSFTIDFADPSVVTPDLCVTAIVFLTAAICCRMCGLNSTWRDSVVLGVALGIGYYAKAAMFPIGLMLLVILFLLPPPGNGARLKVAVSCLVFFIVAAPVVALLSKQAGHLSTGETGRLNYAWYVNGLPLYPSWNPGSLADPPNRNDNANGTPKHKLRTLLYTPEVLEFAAPVKGTNPLGYDPSYWYAGARVRFNLRQQWRAVKTNGRFYLDWFSHKGILFSGVLVLSVLRVRRTTRRPDNNSVWLIMWPAAACGMYALVHVEERFLPGFLVLLWLALYALLWRRVNPSTRTSVLLIVLVTLLVPTAVHIIHKIKTSAQHFGDRPDYMLVGEALRTAGIHQGDFLAAAGGVDSEAGERSVRVNSAFTAYYAHYVGARVVAAIVDHEGYCCSR